MKTLFTIFLFGIPILCLAQKHTSCNFEKTVEDVVRLYAQKDSAMLSTYIDEETGFYLLYRNGMLVTYEHVKNISFNRNEFPWFSLFGDTKYRPVKYEALPTFDCNTQEWSKLGVFVDTTYHDSLLSRTARNPVVARNNKISAQIIGQIKTLEDKSQRIIVSDTDGNDLIFHLTCLNNRWYLYMIDKMTNDCSA